MKQKLWGSARSLQPDKLLIEFTSGKDVKPSKAADDVLIPYDIKINKAHSKMLYKQGILNKQEFKKLEKALDELQKIYEAGNFALDPELEDVHSNIENWLINKLGVELGGKIHTAKSRNDQVTADMYLYLHEQTKNYIESVNGLIESLENVAKKHKDTICPGYTHHQVATVTTFGEILSSFAASFKRDLTGFADLQKKFGYSVLGAVTGYGTTFDIDKSYTAKELGFDEAFENSIDVITNRGEFEANLAFQISSLVNHCSIMAETLILFSTSEFGLIEIPEKLTTGSSIMPQKKNPDVLELIKGKSSYAIGILNTLLSIQSNSFIGYNRETQLTKFLIMDLVAETITIPLILKSTISELKVDRKMMFEKASQNFINTTGLMEQIVQYKNISLRQAKRLVELAVKESLLSGSKHKVTYEALQMAIKRQKIAIAISKDELTKWQDPEYQISLIIKN